MPRTPSEKGERSSYSARYRISVGPATGWDDSHDPSTIEDEGLVEAINCRVHDGIIVSRGGQSKVSDAAGSGECIYGMIEVEGGVRMFLAPAEPPGDPVGGLLDVYTESDPVPYIRLSDANNETGVANNLLASCSIADSSFPRYCFCRWGDKTLYGATYGGIYEMIIPTETPDPRKIKLRQLTYVNNTASSFHVIPGFDNVVYIATVMGEVFSFDGTTRTDISPTLGAPNRIILFSLFGILHAASDYDIQRYNNGIWTPLSLPAGTTFTPTCAAEWNGKAYVGGVGSDMGAGAAALIEIDPAGTCTLVEDDAGNAIIYDMVVWGGYLWYALDVTPSVTRLVILKQYQAAVNVVLDNESDGSVGRLLNVGERLFIGCKVQADTGLGGPSYASLTEVVYPNVTLKVDTFDLFADTVGAFDIVAF